MFTLTLSAAEFATLFAALDEYRRTLAAEAVVLDRAKQTPEVVEAFARATDRTMAAMRLESSLRRAALKGRAA